MCAWLAPQRLDPRTREELLALLEAPSSSGETERLRIEEISRQRAVPVHSALLSMLVHAEMSEEEASAHWGLLCAHRNDLAARLGRDPGIRVAALDYFSREKAFLARPVMVDEAIMDRSWRSATRDGLTGLASPGHFQDLLKREVRRSGRRSRDFSLILLDLDNFTRVNAAHGRSAGDAALREVAGILTARLRDADVAARSGGAHFAIILPGTRRLGAYVVGERIRTAVEEHFRQPLGERERLFLTLSCGAAVFPADGAAKEQLLDRASRALDRARREGGNTVVLHYQEKRKGVRLRPLGKSLRVRVAPGGGRETCILRATDLSCTGALLESEWPFEIGEEMELSFLDQFPESGPAVPARVERLWMVAPGDRGCAFRVGVRFLEDHSGKNEALNSLLAGVLSQGIEQEGDS